MVWTTDPLPACSRLAAVLALALVQLVSVAPRAKAQLAGEVPATPAAVPAPAATSQAAPTVVAPTEPTPPASGPSTAVSTPAAPTAPATLPASKGELFAPNTIVHVPGDGVTFVDGNGSRYRMRMMIAPMLRFTHESTLPDDSLIVTVRRARFSFDTRLPYHLRTRFDMQIKNTALTFRQVWGGWAPSRSLSLYAGLIKPPGGLEMDSSVFEQPFTDRSVLAGMFTKEFHEVGVGADGWLGDTRGFYGLALTRTAPSIEPAGDEPEDKVQVPANAEAEDILNAPSKWNAAWRLGVAPSRSFETSLSGQVRLRPEAEEPDYGETFAEPYEALLLRQRPFWGVSWHVKADAGLSVEHLRALAGVGYRRDGRQLDVDFATGDRRELGGHLAIQSAQLTLGYTPCGHYGPARKNAPLLDGWELLAKIEGARIDPVDLGDVRYLGFFAGWNYQIHPELRLQLDYALQLFDDDAEGGQAGATRHVVNLWAVFRI